MKAVVLACAVVAASLFPASAEPAAFVSQTLVLRDVPVATGPAVVLFNGKDLDDWTGWLGYADPARTYRPDRESPIGIGGKGDVFAVVTEDGAPEGKAVGNSTNWNIENSFNADRPIGQWNTLDLYVYGDRAIHVVNGVPVIASGT